MEIPKSVSELRRFLGIKNQLGKFSPNIAHLSQPLRELLSTKRVWAWGPALNSAFSKELTPPGIPTHYNSNTKTKISADTSSHGLEAVLLQQVNGKWHPVAYASRSLTEAESRYPQIEKEALVATWACEKFASYIQGITITLETDHKPLVPLLNHKHLDSLPPRVLRFHLRLLRFDFVILHVPGKYLHIADALSRAPLRSGVDRTSEVEDIELYVRTVVSTIPASSTRVNSYRLAQEEDATCNTFISYCRNGWPEKHSLPMYL